MHVHVHMRSESLIIAVLKVFKFVHPYIMLVCGIKAPSKDHAGVFCSLKCLLMDGKYTATQTSSIALLTPGT